MEEIAQVYARSLFQVAKERDELDVVREQLGQFADALQETRELAVFFFSPYFSTEEKKAGLAKAVEDGDEAFMNFLELLIEKHRMPAVFRIRRAYDALWEEEHQLLPVQITSAVALDQSIIDRIGQEIGEQTKREVELQTTVDPDVLGGIVLQEIGRASCRERV